MDSWLLTHPSVAALDTAVDTEPSEEHEACGAPQHTSQEHGLLLVQPLGLNWKKAERGR